MIDIKTEDNGYLIDDKIFFAFNDIKNNYINLCKTVGDDFKYGKNNSIIIDYPGEYEISGVFIKSYEGKTGLLSYNVSYDDTKLLIVQDENILQEEEVENINYIICRQEQSNIVDYVNNLEFEGEIITLK